ncbi:methyl-accepting chemotaxis protein [Thiogranum longum]
MTSTVQEVARSAAEASRAADNADHDAKSGALVATEAIGGIDVLLGEVDSAAQVIRNLEKESENIGSVLDVIRGIAEQTNLLALNAAIEAARAGEQGRGFAVVADEVRTLASRTQTSTQEIHDMIQRLQDGAVNAVKVMEGAQSKAQGSSDHVEKVAEALASIAGAVSNINDMNTMIASAAEEQSSVAAEMQSNMNNIRGVSDRSAEGAKQTAQASEELARLAAEQQELMAQFKL